MDLIPLTITDDHAFTRSGMQHQLEADGRFDLLGQAETAVDTINLVRRVRPAIAVVDYVLPDASGLEVLIELSRWVPECRVAILTGREDAAIIAPLLDAGAAGILTKRLAPEEICEALAQIAQGNDYLAPVFAKSVLQAGPEVKLSPRELEVLLRIAQGMSNPAIAADLSLSAKTIESHRGSLMRKLDVTSTATLMIKAARAGLIEV